MADIRWLYTQIGGGKTLYSVHNFYKELERTERGCVNNIPLIFDNAPKGKNPKLDYWTVQECCQANINKPVDVNRRVLNLTAEQSQEFWRYIPLLNITEEQAIEFKLEPVVNVTPFGTTWGWKLPLKPHNLYGHVTDFTIRYKANGMARSGIFYQIDEIHKMFSSRNWQKIGFQLEDYASELRKLNDDLDCITQHPEKVDKNLRRNATEWMQIQNMSKTRLFMGVTLNKRFRYHIYNQSEMPSRNESPTISGWFTLDGSKRLEYSYFTMGGSSIGAGVGTEETRTKGRSPLVWVAALGIILLIAFTLPRFVMSAVQHTIGGVAGSLNKSITQGMRDGLLPKDQTNAVKALPPQPIQPGALVVRSNAPVVPRIIPRVHTPPAPQGAEPPSDLFCTGIMPLGDGTNVWVILSDGRIAKSENDEVQGVGSRYVRVFGYLPIPKK